MANQKKGTSVKKVKSGKPQTPFVELEEDIIEDDSSMSSMDDVYESLQNEFDQIRKCLGMYIAYEKTDAALHLMREIIHNALDEFSNGKAPFDVIEISFDEHSQLFYIKDGGRGIPFNKLKEVCMKKHVSTKYDRSMVMKRYAGRNGVGMKVTVALSDMFKIRSNRNTLTQTIVFNDGEIEVHPVETLKKPVHGLEVSFVPSEKYLGELHVTVDMIEDYLRQLSYIIPEGLTLKFTGTDMEGVTHNFKYKAQGLPSNVDYLSSTLDFPIINFTIDTNDFDIDIAFSYDKGLDLPLVDSYCNYVHTTEGGAHETAVLRAMCEYFVREAKNLDPNAKYEVGYDDCKKGLVLVLAGWHFDPNFEGQHKTKVSNDDFIKVGKDCIKAALTDYFQRNNGLLRKIIGFLRLNVKARMEVVKIKGDRSTKMRNALDYMGIAGFKDITDPNYSTASELIIAEGESAIGAIDNIRNRKYQAILGVMGVVDNVIGLSVEQVMKKPIYENIVTAMGCGIGPNFNITKLRFKKIIILTDQDVDGSNITSLLITFFYTFMPQIIENGYLYKAISPLYKIDTRPIHKYYNGNNWQYSKKELYNLFNKIVADNVSIGIKLDEGTKKETFVELTKSQKMKFLEINEEYLMEFKMLMARTSGNPAVLEYAMYYRMLYKKNLDKFKKAIEAKFPETTFDIVNQAITGSYDGNSVSLIVDDLFDNMASRVTEILMRNDFFEFYYRNKNDKNDVYELTTIAKFFKQMKSLYNINILTRFKGLGEAGDEMLFATTINPKLRRLYRLTVKDSKEALEMIKTFHGKKEEDRIRRRKIITDSHISYADIDN